MHKNTLHNQIIFVCTSLWAVKLQMRVKRSNFAFRTLKIQPYFSAEMRQKRGKRTLAPERVGVRSGKLERVGVCSGTLGCVGLHAGRSGRMRRLPIRQNTQRVTSASQEPRSKSASTGPLSFLLALNSSS